MVAYPRKQEFTQPGLGYWDEYSWEEHLPGYPIQMGPICMVHTMNDLVDTLYRVECAKRCRLLPYYRLSAQYLFDRACTVANTLTPSKNELMKVCIHWDDIIPCDEMPNIGGIIPVEKYCLPHGCKGEYEWSKNRFTEIHGYPVLFNMYMTQVQDDESLLDMIEAHLQREGPAYADFWVPEHYDSLNQGLGIPHDSYIPSPAEIELWKSNSSKERPSHAVLILGWGTSYPADHSAPQRYFKYRNSEGREYGNAGCDQILRKYLASVWIPNVPKFIIDRFPPLPSSPQPPQIVPVEQIGEKDGCSTGSQEMSIQGETKPEKEEQEVGVDTIGGTKIEIRQTSHELPVVEFHTQGEEKNPSRGFKVEKFRGETEIDSREKKDSDVMNPVAGAESDTGVSAEGMSKALLTERPLKGELEPSKVLNMSPSELKVGQAIGNASNPPRTPVILPTVSTFHVQRTSNRFGDDVFTSQGQTDKGKHVSETQNLNHFRSILA